MNTTPFIRAAAVVVALASAVTITHARDLSASAEVVQSRVAGHAYQNGGVSKEQVAQMQQQRGPYNLHLMFSEGPNRAYAADVALQIMDAAGKQVFSLEQAGPLTDVALPAGKYQVVGTFGGVKQGASVELAPGQPASLVLHWLKDSA